MTAATSHQQHRFPHIVMIANRKGGVGKTMLTVHLAWRAVEEGLSVLVLDCDPQGDAYRRLLGSDADMQARPPTSFGEGGWVVCSPGVFDLPPFPRLYNYDLIVIDAPPSGRGLPEGPPVIELLLPVDGLDAARNAVEVAEEALAERRAFAATLVLNKADEGGWDHEDTIRAIEKHLPEGTTLAPRGIPHAEGIKRSELVARPAWEEAGHGIAVRELRAFCTDYVMEIKRWRAWATMEAVLDAAQGARRA
ncbi:MAG: ParA family protein [Pseudomonadota bacterium]